MESAMQRRTFLLGLAGGLFAVTAPAAAFLATRTPHKARAPWAAASLDIADPRVFAFRHAILAPNPHNKQPWLIELVGTDRAVLFCDLDRRLPMTDPNDRQITIGLGCFLELARIAASQRGLRLDMDPFPEGEPGGRLDRRPVAALTFVADPAVRPDPLLAHIAGRRSTKEPFDLARPVGADVLAALLAQAEAGVRASATTGADEVAALRRLAFTAHEIESLTPRTLQESIDVMRIGKAEIEASPDGIDLGGPLLESLRLAGQLSRAQLGDPTSAAFRQGMDMYRTLHATSMAFLWLVTPADTKRAALQAGRVFVRMNLEAARLGLGFHPVSQALQEYPEMAAARAELHQRLGAQGEVVQMFVRLGYSAAPVPPSPRWAFETRLKRA
jgi:nitroreductase